MGTKDPNPVDKWNESDGPVLWWRFPVCEPPYVGTPLDDDFPDYVTHWTRLGPIPNLPPPPPEPCESCGGIHRSPEDWDLSNAECIERLLEQREEREAELRRFRDELAFIKSYLSHTDQDANHEFIVRRINDVLAGRDPNPDVTAALAGAP